jgi:hypothetical protein
MLRAAMEELIGQVEMLQTGDLQMDTRGMNGTI